MSKARNSRISPEFLAMRERRAAYKVGREEIKNNPDVPKAVYSRLTSPARVAVLSLSLDMAEDKPFAFLIEAKADGHRTIEVPEGFNKCLPGVIKGALMIPSIIKKPRKESEIAGSDWASLVNKFQGWARVGVRPTREWTIRLLKAIAADEIADGVFSAYDILVDVNRNVIGDDEVKPGIVFSVDGSDCKEYNAEEMMFFTIMGSIQGIFTGANPEKMFKGFVRVMYAKIHESGGYGYKDPATGDFLMAKCPVFQLVWTINGYGMRPLDEGADELFSKVASVMEGMGVHHQGKFMINLHAEILGVKVVIDGSGKMPTTVIMASTATAKWFKRMTLGMPLQVEPIAYDTGFLTMGNGVEHHGRFWDVMLLEDGLNFPYLGQAISMLTPKGAATKAMVGTRYAVEVDWAGRHTPKLPEIGTKVKKGDVLVSGPDPLIAKVSGEVVEATFNNKLDKTTNVKVVVRNIDRTGQMKSRSQIVKITDSYPAWTNFNWKAFCDQHGFSYDEARIAGDFVILSGLDKDDKVEKVITHDGNKAVGTGNAAGQISLIANTLGQYIRYCPYRHLMGDYAGLIAEYTMEYYRPEVKVAYVMLNEIAEAVRKANRDDVEFYTCGELTVVVQTTAAWLGKDLQKVESLSVRESVTRNYSPLEVASMARALGRPLAAADLVKRGEFLAEQVEALYQTVTPADSEGKAVDVFFKDIADEKYMELLAAKCEELGVDEIDDDAIIADLEYRADLYGFIHQGVSVMDTMKVIDITELDASQRAQLAYRSRDPLGLKVRMAFVDSLKGLMVIVDPVVLNAFGKGDPTNAAEKESLKSFFSQLCFNAAEGNIDLAGDIINRMGGMLRNMSTTTGVMKRLHRGASSIQAKTAAGNVPQGWVAMAYKGTVAKLLAKEFGFVCRKVKGSKALVDRADKSRVAARLSSVAKTQVVPTVHKAFLHPVDGLWGQMVDIYRAPQTAPLPLRVYMPDAPAAVLNLFKADLPLGSMFTKQIRLLEPDRFFMSPFDTAADNGDHDGDGRNMIAITCALAWAEAMAWRKNAEAYRRMVLSTYMKNVIDPVVAAYSQEKNKKAWAKPKEVFHSDFVSLSVESIINQTADIGFAYNMAHMALSVCGDLVSPSMRRALITHTLFVGQYEEQLAGLNKSYRALYKILLEDSEFRNDDGTLNGGDYLNAIDALNGNDDINHNEADSVNVRRFATLVKGGSLYARKGEIHQDLEGWNIAYAMFGKLVRSISQGTFDKDGKVRPIFKRLPEILAYEVEDGKTFEVWLAEMVADGSVGAYSIKRFVDRIAPLFLDMSMEGEDDNEIED